MNRTASWRSPLIFLGGLLALYLLAPVALFLWRAAQADNLGFGADGLFASLWTSIESATLSTVIVALLGIPLAHWLAAGFGWRRSALGVAVQLPLALPPVMSGIVLIYLVGPYTWLGTHLPFALTNSLTGVIIAQTFVSAPFLVIATRSAFGAIPRAIPERAATLGLGPAARFWRVELPIAAPGILAGALLTWLRALGEYGATSLIAYHPFTLPVYTSQQFDGSGLPGTAAPTLLALALAVVVLVLAHVRRPRRASARLLPEPHEPPHSTPVTVSFDVFDQVGDFSLVASYRAKSPRLAILGPSGAGKSLILRALAGLRQVNGHVALGHDDITALPPEARHLGYVPQMQLLFEHRSLWQNSIFAKDADPAVAAWWLQSVGLSDRAHQRASTLSGGERQRGSLVQALANSPRLLLLDEPFSALDTNTHTALRAKLRSLQQLRNLSSVIVTHDPRDALLLSDEVILLEDGRIIQAGPTPEVFARPASLSAARLLGLDNVFEITGSDAADNGCLGPDDFKPGDFRQGQSDIPTQSLLARIASEHVRLERAEDGFTNGIPAEVVDVVETGRATEIYCRCAATGAASSLARVTLVSTSAENAADLAIGDRVSVHLKRDHLMTWAAPSAPTT